MNTTVTYRGKKYPLAEMGTWSYDEAEFAESVVGLTTGQIALAQQMGGAKAALGFAVVSLRRAGVEFDPDTIGSTPLDDLIVDFIGTPAEETADEEESTDGPPAVAAAAAAGEAPEPTPASEA